MNSAFLPRGLVLAALAAAAVLAGCASNKEAEAEAARLAAEAAALARMPPPISLNDSVAQSASIYVAFTRDMAATRGGFTDPEAVQAALRKGSAYDPAQLSRGLIAYASILALQSPEFVAGVRQYAHDPALRQKMVADIVANPHYASTLPGADSAAGLIMQTLREDIDALGRAATSVEQDAYDIQVRSDPRRAWAVAQVADRESRLENAKVTATHTMLPSADDAARLLATVNSGGGQPFTGTRRAPPYPPAVTNALAIAALAALGAAGDNGRANTDALQNEPTGQYCLNMSKLNLYQCLAASRPSYEDMFCVGRHIVRDLATCTRGAAMPGALVFVSDPVTASAPVPAISPAALEPPVPSRSIVVAPTPAPVQTPAATPAPVRTPALTPPPAPAPAPPTEPAASVTERLNTRPANPPD